MQLLAGEIRDGDTVTIDASAVGLVVPHQPLGRRSAPPRQGRVPPRRWCSMDLWFWPWPSPPRVRRAGVRSAVATALVG